MSVCSLRSDWSGGYTHARCHSALFWKRRCDLNSSAKKKAHTRHSCRCTCETRAGGWGKKAQNSGMFGLLSVRLMNVCVCVSCQRWCSVKTTHNVLHALCYSLWTSDSCWCVMCGAISTSMMLCEKQTVLTEDIFSNGTVGFWLVIGRKVSVNFLQQQLWH